MGKTKLYPKFKYKDGFSVMDRIESVEHPFLEKFGFKIQEKAGNGYRMVYEPSKLVTN